ncbi:MAG TPA: hypothetical protein VE865_12205 [Bradyrhizobium sp.]|nr:hypothetical protein [Bradyrhizobium sp.]
MTNRSEFGLRAALCRQLAMLEPANRALWLAEAQYWAQLAKDTGDGDGGRKLDEPPVPAGLRARLARRLPFPEWTGFAEA